MEDLKKNYYGSLCTEMYEILHAEAAQDELDFYLSFAKEGELILEPLCGSGRFLVPFAQRGFTIHGVDNSHEMTGKLLEKLPGAVVDISDIETYQTDERFDYIFISSGSVSLFTDMAACRRILANMRALLKEGGRFVFAVDTVANRGEDFDEYRTGITVETKEGYQLVLKGKSHYDEATQTSFGPSLYELYDGEKLLCQEAMDFQTHLYEFGEMEEILKEIGFSSVITYSGYDKTIAKDSSTEMFLYECVK